jgi:hypothetical protein
MSADRERRRSAEPYLPAAADALARAASAARPPPPGPFTLLDVKHSPVPLKLTWCAGEDVRLRCPLPLWVEMRRSL